MLIKKVQEKYSVGHSDVAVAVDGTQTNIDAKQDVQGDGGDTAIHIAEDEQKREAIDKSRENVQNVGGRPKQKEKMIGGDECNIKKAVGFYYSNSNSLHTPVRSDDEEVTSLPKYPTFYKEMDMNDPKPQQGWNLQFTYFIR